MLLSLHSWFVSTAKMKFEIFHRDKESGETLICSRKNVNGLKEAHASHKGWSSVAGFAFHSLPEDGDVESVSLTPLINSTLVHDGDSFVFVSTATENYEIEFGNQDSSGQKHSEYTKADLSYRELSKHMKPKSQSKKKTVGGAYVIVLSQLLRQINNNALKFGRDLFQARAFSVCYDGTFTGVRGLLKRTNKHFSCGASNSNIRKRSFSSKTHSIIRIASFTKGNLPFDCKSIRETGTLYELVLYSFRKLFHRSFKASPGLCEDNEEYDSSLSKSKDSNVIRQILEQIDMALGSFH